MCATSAIIEQWRNPQSPNFIPWPQVQQDPMLAWQMQDIIKRLEAIDKRLGLLEQCKVSAKEKKSLKAKLRRIAKRVAIPQNEGPK